MAVFKEFFVNLQKHKFVINDFLSFVWQVKVQNARRTETILSVKLRSFSPEVPFRLVYETGCYRKRRLSVCYLFKTNTKKYELKFVCWSILFCNLINNQIKINLLLTLNERNIVCQDILRKLIRGGPLSKLLVRIWFMFTKVLEIKIIYNTISENKHILFANMYSTYREQRQPT